MKPRLLCGFLVATTLALLVACGTSSPATSGASGTTVQVTLADFKVTSSLTTFAMNTPYRFVVTNTGQTAHEFMVAPPMASGMAMSDMDKQSVGMIDTIAPGQTKTLDVTFTPADMSKGSSAMSGMGMGSLELACHLPGHYEAGMHVTITVNS